MEKKRKKEHSVSEIGDEDDDEGKKTHTFFLFYRRIKKTMPRQRGALAAALVVVVAVVAAAWLRGGGATAEGGKRAEDLIQWLKTFTSRVTTIDERIRQWSTTTMTSGHHTKDFVPHCSLLPDGHNRDFVVAAERVVLPDGNVVPAASA